MTSSLGGFQPLGKKLGRGGVQGDYTPSGYRTGQLQQFNPEQMKLFSQLFGHLGPESFLSKLAGGDESFFEQMEAPANRQFQGLLGQIASRFSGMGTGGRHSSGFQNATTSAASNFVQDLAANRMNLQRQALNDLMGFSNQLLQQRPQERFLTEKRQKEPSGWGSLLGGLGGAALGSIGGPGGALAGAGIGSQLFGGF